MSTREYDEEAIRAEFLDYLRTPEFTHFMPADVADYGSLGQIWVKTRPASGCERDWIFDYRIPVMMTEHRCELEHLELPPAAYITETAVVAEKFASLADQHATVIPTRNRPIPPNQPPHPTLS